jgi:hypothetical protein
MILRIAFHYMKTGTDESNSKMLWRGYLKTISLGCNLAASSARVCMMLDCTTPSAARQKIANLNNQGKITQDENMNYLDAVSDLAGMYKRGFQTHTVATPGNDWADINCGAHVRINHFASERRGA